MSCKKNVAVALLLFCFIIQADTLPARTEIKENDNSTYIEDTIKEVETLIKANPSLPRLTRGEIIDILDNLTKTDNQESNNTRNEKAIMVVLPYSSKNIKNENIQELYSRPPITKIIDEGENKININKIKTTTSTTEKPTIKDEFVYKFKPIRTKPTNKPIIEIATQKPLSQTSFKPLRITPTLKTTTKRFPNHKYPEEKSTTFKPIITATHNFVTIKPDVSKIKKKQVPKLPEIVEIPDDFKHVLKNLDSLIKEDPNYSNQYDSFAIKLPNENDNVKNILESINNIKGNTTTNAPEILDVANNLTPEMKDILKTFGLLPEENLTETSTQATKTNSFYIEPYSDTDPESYTGFKPLPQNTKISDQSMEDILKQFGLTEDSSRAPKAISNKKSKINTFDVVPEQFKDVLTDIGLTQTHVKNEVPKKEKQHVFNPIKTPYANTVEVERLNNLVTTLKNLEQLNRTITDDDLKNVDLDELKHLVGSLNVPLDQQKGLNPIDFGLNMQKNEVKRQESTTTESGVTNENPSVDALAESFGGATEAEIEAAPTEPPRRTGFYYLVDWNSFFDIDDQKGKRVNLRFQPTIGDPKRFLSVTVP